MEMVVMILRVIMIIMMMVVIVMRMIMIIMMMVVIVMGMVMMAIWTGMWRPGHKARR